MFRMLDDYMIVRLAWREVSPLEYVLHLRTIISRPVQVTIALAARPVVALVVRVRDRVPDRAPNRTPDHGFATPQACATSVAIGVAPRQTIFHRIEFILQSMRGGFAPAASLFWEYLCSMPDKAARRSLQRSRYIAGGGAGETGIRLSRGL